MPILALERTHFPDNLFDQDPSERSKTDCVWSVLHTRPRQEKALIRQFLSAGIGFYLPLIGKQSPIRGRIVTSYLPLFPGYVFLQATPEDRVKALALAKGRIVQSLAVREQAQLWRDLSQIHTLIDRGLSVQPEGRLEPGLLVEIKSGPLAGLRGKIVREVSHRRFVVAVDFIQQGVSILLDDHLLIPAIDADLRAD